MKNDTPNIKGGQGWSNEQVEQESSLFGMLLVLLVIGILVFAFVGCAPAPARSYPAMQEAFRNGWTTRPNTDGRGVIFVDPDGNESLLGGWEWRP